MVIIHDEYCYDPALSATINSELANLFVLLFLTKFCVTTWRMEIYTKSLDLGLTLPVESPTSFFFGARFRLSPVLKPILSKQLVSPLLSVGAHL